MRGAVLALVLLLAACGNPNQPQAQSSAHPTATVATTPSAAPSSSPTPSTTTPPIHVTPPAAGLVFAVVEGTVASGCCGGEPTSAGTVAIVGLDGYARAKATFLPRKLPPIGHSVVMLQAPAVVAGSGVYYLDGNGAVRVLRVNSAPRVVATFSQQGHTYETWFAVSADGSSIVAGVVTFDSVGSYFSLYTAKAGGSPTQTVNAEAVGPPDAMVQVPFPVGWISSGAVAMNPDSLTTQMAWFGGPLQVLTFGPGGVQGSSVGGPDCRSASITPTGLIPCISSNEVVSVRDAAGKLIWTTQVPGVNALSLYLSPDGQAISDGQRVESHVGGAVQMPQGFRVEGWLDSNTIIGAVTPPGGSGEGNLSWISLGDPSTVHDLGFKGDFVNTLA
jgi:hypothetical protein